MRMIVEAFKDTLELGLEKPKQVVVRRPSIMTQNQGEVGHSIAHMRGR
jgi:hypothetical protein